MLVNDCIRESIEWRYHNVFSHSPTDEVLLCILVCPNLQWTGRSLNLSNQKFLLSRFKPTPHPYTAWNTESRTWLRTLRLDHARPWREIRFSASPFTVLSFSVYSVGLSSSTQLPHIEVSQWIPMHIPLLTVPSRGDSSQSCGFKHYLCPVVLILLLLQPTWRLYFSKPQTLNKCK